MHANPTTSDSASPSRFDSITALWPFLRRYPGLLSGWLIALGLSSLATLCLPLAIGRMIDQGFGSGTRIDSAFLVLFLVAVGLGLATAARLYFVSLLGESVIRNLRDQLYAHLIALDASFHDNNRSGELISRLATDSELLRNMVATTISVALRSAVTAAGALIGLFATSPRLAAYSLLGIPLAILPVILGARRLKRASRESQDAIAAATGRASERLGAIRTVQAYAREDYEQRCYRQTLDAALATARRRISTQAVVTAAAIVLIFGAIVLVLWNGAHAVAAGEMSAGALGQFVVFAMIGGGSIGALAEVWNELQRAAGGMGRVSELLAQPVTIHAPASPMPLPAPVRGELELRDIHFHYPQRSQAPVLQGINLHIRPGETVALVGPSGAGKSSLLTLMMRFYDPQQGQVCLDGVDVRQLDPQQLRQAMALVPQHPVLFAGSALENIRYGRLDASDEEVFAAARAAEADGFLAALPEGYHSELGERGTRLSGGQQQRVAIARALLRDAPVLLLDEATSALDAQSEHAVQQALTRLMQGRTTVVIAHRLATVMAADRIVVMDQGRIVAEGRHEELLAAGGLYAELAHLQFIH